MIRFLQTPTKTKKIVLGSLLVIICIMMVVTLVPGGIGNISGADQPGVLATVGGQEVTIDEARKVAQNIVRQQRYPEEAIPILLPGAADRIITNKALLYEADRLGLSVSNEELAQGLKSEYGEMFFPGGKFIGEEQYRDFIEQNTRGTVAEFEDAFRSQLMLRKLQSLVGGGAVVSDGEVDNLVRQQQTKVKFDYAVVSMEDVEKGIHPTDPELRSYFDQHQAQYTNSIPEKRKVRLVVVDGSKLPGAAPSDADIQGYYNQHQDEYRTPETVKLRHILVKSTAGPDGKPDATQDAAAKAKAEQLFKQAKSGNFADLAKKNSDDPGSKDNGGYMEVTRGQTVPDFEKAAFSAKAGEIVGPVKTVFGYHIIKVEAHQQAGLKPLSEVRDQIVSVLAQQKAASAAQRVADALRNDARSQGLEKAAASRGLAVTTTGFISRSDILPGIGPEPELMNAIFSAPANAGANEAQIRQGYAVFDVAEVQPPSTPTFDEAKGRVEQAFKADRARTLLMQKAQQLADRARADHDLKKAAKEAGATLKTSDLVGSSAQVPDLGSMGGPAAIVFTLKPGEIAGPIQGGRNAVVLSLVQRQEPTAQEIQAAAGAARAQLLSRKRDEQMAVYADSLVKQMEKGGQIKRNKKAFDALSSRSALGS